MRRRDFLKGSLFSGVGIGSVSVASLATASSLKDVTGSNASNLDALAPHQGINATITPTDLRCESMSNPLSIDTMVPRLSWKLKSAGNARNQVQTAYRIQVASTLELLSKDSPDLWDSAKVTSDHQLHVEYLGSLLKSGDRCYWKVEVWDGEGRKSIPSADSWWEMGLLSPSDWTGSWIESGKILPESDEGFYEIDPAPLFRRSFSISKPIRKARLYATALGYHDLRINGTTLGNNVLEPAWTNTKKRVYYTSHDVTQRLNQGENVIGVMLGNGWRNPLPLRMWGRINIREHLDVGQPSFLSELVIEYEDGSTGRIATDGSWRTADGPLLKNSVYLGEVYDARLEQPGWDGPNYDDSSWKSAIEVTGGNDLDRPLAGMLQALPVPPIRATRLLSAVSLNEVSPGVYIFDFGQNFAGWARLKVKGPKGTSVHMRMGELLKPDGSLNPMTAVAGQIKGLKKDGSPQGGPGAPEIAWQENTFILRGDGEEEYTPRFTFHGFRYVEVTGFPGKPELSAVLGMRLNTDVESVGTFSCSNDGFNRIQEIVRWTLLSNMFSVQSDCPAREKYQYGGDIVATSEMAIFNYDMATFYAKTVSDHRDAALDGWFTETAPFVGISAENYVKLAGPISWGLAHPLLVAQLYRYYGDRRIVEDHFGAAKTWVDLLEGVSTNHIIDKCIGDHETLDPNPVELIATAHFFQAASMVAEFANILGETEERDKYVELAQQIKNAFVERFVETGTGRVGIATQAAQSSALFSGLVPELEVGLATKRMVDAVLVDHKGHIATGIFGTKYLLNVLHSSGHAETAYQLVKKDTYPGWGHMVENGATTLWETWAQSDNVYSQNHPMFGSVSEWFFKSLGGIAPSPDAVGFDRFVVEPFVPSDMEWADASYASVRGILSSSWRKVNGQIQMNVVVPVNTKAIVRIPTSDAASVQEGGKPVAEVPSVRQMHAKDSNYFELGSGRYQFTASAPKDQ
ncbi:MAG: family 78 glycoside hydrolase catalytic domain [Bacteroidetes bacterium]|nr:family 78 glycoside hydrolase catalytic domain [Bacteroidota bacterium]